VLARFARCDDRPDSFEVTCSTEPLPAALFDIEKVDEYLKGRPNQGIQGLIEALLSDHGFEAVR